MEPNRIVSTNKNDKCQGYTIDHRPCRLKRETGKITCRVHKAYFKNWTVNHPPIISSDIKRALQKRYSNELISGLKYINTKKYIEGITRDTAYTSYYLLLCSCSPEINPMWNTYHFKYAIRILLEDIFSKSSLGTVDSLNTITHKSKELLELYRLFNTILVDNSTIYYGYKFCITELIRLIWIHSRVFNNRTVELDSHLCELILQWQGWRELFYTSFNLRFYDKKLLPNYLTEDALNYIFYNIITPALKNNHNLFLMQQRSRCNIYKEELMQVVWHPVNVERLMNLGVDPDDM